MDQSWVEKEGAEVTYGLPPFDTNTGGDKATTTSRPGLTAESKAGVTSQSLSIEGDKAGSIKQPGSKDDRGGKK